MKRRDPAWRWRRALGHKIVKNKKTYSRKSKHQKPRQVRGSFLFGGNALDANVDAFNNIAHQCVNFAFVKFLLFAYPHAGRACSVLIAFNVDEEAAKLCRHLDG